MKKVLALLIIAILPAASFAASLKGSKVSLRAQNYAADRDDLSRIQDKKMLERFKRNKLLVPLPSCVSLTIDSRLAPELRCCRPWTRDFILELATEFYKKFQKPLKVNSAVRTVSHQRRLMKKNANAAESSGDLASSHLTGATLDLAKKELTPSQLKWLRNKLLELEEQGQVEATEEFYQSVFHVMVYRPSVKLAER